MVKLLEQAIICVDDDKFLLNMLVEQIRGWVGEKMRIEKANSGAEALELLDSCIKDGVDIPLFISDYIMPGMNGAEVLAEVHKRDRHTKTVMLTGHTAVEGIVSAINKAALYRFIAKPWNANDMMLTVTEALRLYDQEQKNRMLVQSFEKLYRGYESQLNYWTKAFSHIIDIKSDGKEGHAGLVASISMVLGKGSGMNADDLKVLKTAALFHDIGRLILTEEDIAAIRPNEALIYDYPQFIIKQNDAAREIFSRNSQLDSAYLKGIVNHYEKFNGTGVNKLEGKNIPLEARIIGISSYYAVLISQQNAPSPSAALSMISSLSGTVFDPKLFALFSKIDFEKLKNTL